MANYSDLQGYKFISPVSALKKPLGNGSQIGTQIGSVWKLMNNNTNVFTYSKNHFISPQTTGISANPISIVSTWTPPLLLNGTNTTICKIEDWNLNITISVTGNKQHIDPSKCFASYSGAVDSSEKGKSVIYCGNKGDTESNRIGDVSEVVICLYKTKVDLATIDGKLIKMDVIELGAFAHGDYLGYKGWFLVAGLGWVPEYFGKTPTLKSPDAKTDSTEYGGGYRGTNSNSTQGVPDLPNFSYANHGKKTYLLTASQSDALHQFMWSTDFVDALVKIYAQPMQTIESMFVNDCYATGNTPANINLGNVNTGISATLTNSFIEVDCGSVFYNEEYGSYIDYEPYVSFQLYLPRIGVVPISAKDVVNNAIHILYQIDVVTGFGTCYVIVTRTRDQYTEVLMQISAQMLTSIPYSGMDASARVNAAAQCVTNLIGGNLMGAGTNALNTLIAPCNVQKSPISSSLLLSQKKPMLMVTRTKAVLPDTYGEDIGYMCMVSDKLAGKTGFFKIRDAHTPMINNDAWIAEEIDRLLEQGVYIKK